MGQSPKQAAGGVLSRGGRDKGVGLTRGVRDRGWVGGRESRRRDVFLVLVSAREVHRRCGG